jgi:hypothetical protein
MNKITDTEITGVNAARADELAREVAWRQQQQAQNAARTARLANFVSHSRKVRPSCMRKWAVNLCLLAAVMAVVGVLAVILGRVQ